MSGGPSAPYGRYGNIFLSQTEYDELQAEYPDRLERLIEEMSHYLAASGKSYQNYAAALRIWAGNDKKEAPKKGIPDYSCMVLSKEETSLSVIPRDGVRQQFSFITSEFRYHLTLSRCV